MYSTWTLVPKQTTGKAGELSPLLTLMQAGVRSDQRPSAADLPEIVKQLERIVPKDHACVIGNWLGGAPDTAWWKITTPYKVTAQGVCKSNVALATAMQGVKASDPSFAAVLESMGAATERATTAHFQYMESKDTAKIVASGAKVAATAAAGVGAAVEGAAAAVEGAGKTIKGIGENFQLVLLLALLVAGVYAAKTAKVL